MKKNGFTLIELLAVIVILAVILAIAVPAISSIINNVTVNALINNNKMLVKAARNYIATDESNLPINIGDTKEIKLSDLQANNYIGTIKSPSNKTIECDGYVIVTKIGSTDYDYTPHLNCVNNIGSVSEDGLISHYKFDDFQEPTENLFIQNVAPSSVHPDWSITRIDDKTYKLQALIDNPATYAWNFVGYITNSVSTPINQTVTMSCLVADKNTSLLIPYMAGFGALNSPYGSRLYKTQVYNQIWTYSTVMYAVTPASIKAGDYIVIKEPQLEYKDHPTPFVDGTRAGIVKDYSSNNRTATLQLSSTPKWVSSSKVGSGAYELDGINDYIGLSSTLSTILNNSNFTLSAWIKSSGMASGMSLAGIISLGYGLSLSLDSGGNLNGRMDNGTSLPMWNTTGINLHDNQYHYVVMTYNGTYMRLYVDGIMRKEATTIWNNRYSNAGAIGYEANNPPSYRFWGSIDDVQIYNRALDETEITQMYNTNK